MAMENEQDAAHAGAWHELKHDAAGELLDGPTFAQAPVLFLDEADASLKADGADPLKSRRRRRPSEEATPTSAPNGAVDAGVAFSSFELSYVPPHEALPVGAVAPYTAVSDPHYQPRLTIPADNVGAFLQSLTLTFAGNLSTLDFLRARLAEMGYDSIFALAFVSPQELAMAGIAFPNDQHAIRTCAHQEFVVRRPPSPPDLYQMVTMSKWLMLCGIPRQMATVYTTHLQRFGYDSVQHFESIGHDSRALSVFRPGHYHLFKYHLERVLQQQQQQQQQYATSAATNYNMYYNTAPAPARTDEFNPTLLDDLVPAGFPMSPAVHGMRQQPTTAMYQQASMAASGFYPQAEAALTQGVGSSFTQLMHDGTGAGHPATMGGPPMRRLKDNELRLLYEAVNMDDKTNPCRRGKKVDWSVIATNGMGEPRFALLAQYTAEELEHNYVQNHELPLHTTARNSEWSAELIKLLWKVSQDTRCKNGTKTMWEQIAQGRTGVSEYQPLSKFSNSQLRSRFRTEFGDKRPQSRKKARETKNALAKAAAMGMTGVSPGDKSLVQLKNVAKQKAAAVIARKQSNDDHRFGSALSGEEPLSGGGSMAV